MNIGTWILVILITFSFALAGTNKLLNGRQKYINKLGKQALWATKINDQIFIVIGTIEVVGALMLIAPAILGTGQFIIPIVAGIFAAMMALAVFLHYSIGDNPMLMVPASILCTLNLLLLLFNTI